MNLAELSNMARDRSSEGRKKFVAKITDIFMMADETNIGGVSALFNDIILKVFDDLDLETRAQLARRFSTHANAPRDLLTLLSNDEIQIAASVLTHSLIITDADLISIIKTQSDDHVLAICRRAEISTQVSTPIIERGQIDALQHIAANHSACFTAPSLLDLVGASKNDSLLQEALIRRPDLSLDAALKLVSFLDHDLTNKIQDIDASGLISRAIAENAARNIQARLQGLNSARQQVEKIFAAVEKGSTSFEEALKFFINKDQIVNIAVLISGRVEIPEAEISPLILSKNDAPLAILCKYCGVSDECFRAIIKYRENKINVSSESIEKSLSKYSQLTLEQAEKSLAIFKEKSHQPH